MNLKGEQFKQQESFETKLEKYGERIKNTLYEAIKKQLTDVEPSEKIGVALSGGIDSTIVAHLLKKLRGDNVIAFTLHAEGYESEESDLEPATKAAQALSLKHKIVNVSPKEIISSAEPVAKLITPPGRKVHDFNIYSGVVTHLLAPEIKKAGVRICFSGEGLDELAGSYGPSGSFQHSHENMTTSEMRKKLFNNLTQRGYLDRTTKTLGQYGIEARSPYLDEEFSKLMLSIPPEFFNQKDWKLPLIKAFEKEVPIPLGRPKVRAQVGSGIFKVLQEAGYNQEKLKEIIK